MYLRRLHTICFSAALASAVFACGPTRVEDDGGVDATTPGSEASPGPDRTQPPNDTRQDTAPTDTTPNDMGVQPGPDGGDGGDGAVNPGLDGGDGAVTPTDAATDANRNDGNSTVGSCTMPLGSLNPTGDRKTGTFDGLSRFPSTSCQSNAAGSDGVYTLNLTQPTGVHLKLESAPARLADGGLERPRDTVLSIRRTCTDVATEVACNDDGPIDLGSELSAVLPAGNYFVIIDQYNTASVYDYILTYDTFQPAANATCSNTAPMLTPGAGNEVMGDTSRGSADPNACRDPQDGEGNGVFYRLDIPANNRATITATPLMATNSDAGFMLPDGGARFLWNPVIHVMESCTGGACLAHEFGGTFLSNGPATATIGNSTGTTKTVFVSVLSEFPGDGGTFRLGAVVSVIPPVAVCNPSATPVASGSTLLDQDVSQGIDRLNSSCLSFDDGPVVYYTARVPANNTLTVTVTPKTSWNSSIRILEDCRGTDGGVPRCAANNDSGFDGQEDRVSYTNTGADRTVLIAVGSEQGSQGRFDMRVDIRPPASNATCSTPRVLGTSGDTRVNNEDLALARTTIAACLPTATGNNLYYEVVVQPGSTLFATATPSAGQFWNPVVRLLNSCMASSCIAEADNRTSGSPETLSYTNEGTNPQTLVLAVGSASATSFGTFDLSVTTRAAPTNVACANPRLVMNGTNLTFENASRGTTDFVGPCLPTAGGTVLFYSAVVPPGQILTVNATPLTQWDAVIRLVDSCTATTCRASADLRTLGGAERIVHVNNTTSPQNLIFAVGSKSLTTSGPFDLTVSIALPPYAESNIATAVCDNMSGATRLAGVTTDDSASSVTALPAPFTFFGETVSHYSVTSNGFMQLWPNSSGTPSTSLSNVAIPTSGTPNRFIAPFWDDLTSVPGVGDAGSLTGVDVKDFPSAAQPHFTVQWTGWKPYSFSLSADAGNDVDLMRLTFQVQLYRTSNVIEMHYCDLSAPSGTTSLRHLGGEATIGVEDNAGERGFQHSFDPALNGMNMPGVQSGTGLRFTPQ